MPDLEKATSVGLRVEKLKKQFFKYYLANCPTLFRICYDPIGTHKRERAFIGFLLGFLMGVFLYEFIIVDLQFDSYTSVSLGGILIAMLSIGCASSIQVRCICILTIPTFFGRAGRSMLRAMIVGYIIAGPLFNLVYNAKEVVRSFGCTTQLSYNLTKTRFDLMFKPFQQARNSCNEIGCERNKGHPLFGERSDEPSRGGDRRRRGDDAIKRRKRLSGRITG